jgi:drug/metabolite transporter (DMT)-like permease
LVIGIAIGISMALWPGGHLVYRPAHAHANLLGFLSMFLFGVTYHVLPRFVQKPLSERRQRWAMRHFWIQNAGLGLMVGGWLTRPTWGSPGQGLLIAGGLISAIGVGIFVTLAWRITGERGGLELRSPPGG